MLKKQKPLPAKWFSVLFTIIFLLCQLVFFLTTIGNMPVLIDTIDLTGFEKFATLFNKYYFYFCSVAGITELAMCITTFFLFYDRKWPTLLTFITMCLNWLICTLTICGLYLLDLRNVYFTFQATFAIPIISIFLSSVFIIDDTIDLQRGKFELHTSTITERAQETLKVRANDFIGGTRFDPNEYDFIKNIDERNEEQAAEAYSASRKAAMDAIPDINRLAQNSENKNQ